MYIVNMHKSEFKSKELRPLFMKIPISNFKI